LTLLTLGLLCLAPAFAASKAGGPRQMHETPDPAASRASIRVRGNPRASQRVALAKVSFDEALKAAVTAVPGRVASGEIEVDDGNLVYSFTIIANDGKVTEVQVDAGNGKVLSVDAGDDE
jgi:uncharacterized membrane protein YkoI